MRPVVATATAVATAVVTPTPHPRPTAVSTVVVVVEPTVIPPELPVVRVLATPTRRPPPPKKSRPVVVPPPPPAAVEPDDEPTPVDRPRSEATEKPSLGSDLQEATRVYRQAVDVHNSRVDVKDWLTSEGYNPAKIVVIPNGVELDRFNEPADPGRVRHELGIPAGAPMVMVVSRLTRKKGLEQFLEAAEMLLPRFPDARFVIVGYANPAEQDYENTLKVLTDRLGLTGRVTFTGLRHDVPSLLAAATVSVMPSLDEALSNVLLESMAAGAPTVATRVGGTPEAIVDEMTGLLVEPGDSLALADAIARLLGDPALARRLGDTARKAIEDRYSVDKMVRATEALYLDLLARRHRKTSAGFSHVLGRLSLR